MYRAGLLLALHQVEPRCPLSKDNDGCQCYMASHLRVDETTGFPPYEWIDWAGPHVVSTVDGSDLPVDTLRLAWYFVVYVRSACGIENDEFKERYGMTPQQAVTPQQFRKFVADLQAHFISGERLGWLRLSREEVGPFGSPANFGAAAEDEVLEHVHHYPDEVVAQYDPEEARQIVEEQVAMGRTQLSSICRWPCSGDPRAI